MSFTFAHVFHKNSEEMNNEQNILCINGYKIIHTESVPYVHNTYALMNAQNRYIITRQSADLKNRMIA